jgi:YihY family inner membrane protein
VAVIGLLGAFFFASAFLSAFSETVVFTLLGQTTVAREVVTWGGSLAGAMFAFVAFIILYKTFPHAKVEWRDALLAAVVATLLWHTAKYVYELYLVHFARFNLVYGSVGAVIGLLLWGYISATIVLFCAELSAARAHKRERARLQELHPT